LEPMLEGMLGGCSSELRTQILETQNPELRKPRASARAISSAPSKFHKEIVAAYHEICPDLPPVKIWTEGRRKSLDARIAERRASGKPADTIDYWRSLF